MKPQINEGNFYRVINKAIAEGRHAPYLKAVIKRYENYKREFEKKFTEKNPSDTVYKFRVNYLLKRPVWREFEILGEQTFEELADIIIFSMEWLNDHMHGFRFTKRQPTDPYYTGSSLEFFAPGWEDDPHPTYKTNKIRICDIDYEKTPKLRFMFDYGAGHEFAVIYKGIRKIDKNEKNKKDFPLLVDQRGVAPEQYPDYE